MTRIHTSNGNSERETKPLEEELQPFCLRLIPLPDDRVSYLFSRLEQDLRWRLDRHTPDNGEVKGITKHQTNGSWTFLVNLDEYLPAILGNGSTEQESRQLRQYAADFEDRLKQDLRRTGMDYSDKQDAPRGRMIIIKGNDGKPTIGLIYNDRR